MSQEKRISWYVTPETLHEQGITSFNKKNIKHVIITIDTDELKGITKHSYTFVYKVDKHTYIECTYHQTTKPNIVVNDTEYFIPYSANVFDILISVDNDSHVHAHSLKSVVGKGKIQVCNRLAVLRELKRLYEYAKHYYFLPEQKESGKFIVELQGVNDILFKIKPTHECSSEYYMNMVKKFNTYAVLRNGLWVCSFEKENNEDVIYIQYVANKNKSIPAIERFVEYCELI